MAKKLIDICAPFDPEYADDVNLFIYENDVIPLIIRDNEQYDSNALLEHFKEKVPTQLKKYYSIKIALENGKQYYGYCIIPLKKEFFLSLDTSHNEKAETCKLKICCAHDLKEEAFALIKELAIHKATAKQSECNIIAFNNDRGFHLREFDIKTPQVDLELNYGPELAEKHKILMERLREEDSTGISLLHGPAGTGKTHYIRHIISQLGRNRQVIYVPPALVPQLSDPSFIAFMMTEKNSILIVEDAEEIVMSREGAVNSSGVHNLLNMADGFLGEAMGVQVICTFNSKVDKIDSALKRKGRIVIEHEFRALPMERACKLAENLKLDIDVKEPMTLADIYNSGEQDFSDKKQEKIGFK